MKKIILSVIALLSLNSLLLAEPIIEFDKLEHDFGNINQKTIVKEIFVFTNTGDSVLIINSIETTCGCTGSLLSDKEIPAGKGGNIEISFNSGTYSGKIIRSIYIFTNDPKNEKIKIKIQATVNQEE